MELFRLVAIAWIWMAILTLVVTGFVLFPWVVGVALLVPLVFFFREPIPSPNQGTSEKTATKSNASKSQTVQPNGAIAQISTEPVLIYRGTKYTCHLEATQESEEPDGVETFGKYRGNPWKAHSQSAVSLKQQQIEAPLSENLLIKNLK
jgi:hypothetical protein